MSDTQGPGWYRYRAARGAPWQAVRIVEEGGLWFVLLNGKPVHGSGAAHLHDIPFVHPPASIGARMFHPVTEPEYLMLLDALAAAEEGTPLATPDAPVDLRNARSLF